MVEKLLINLLY